MRQKLIALTFALAATAAALVLAPRSSEASTCNGFRVCCSPTGPCYCCSHPCSIQCP